MTRTTLWRLALALALVALARPAVAQSFLPVGEPGEGAPAYAVASNPDAVMPPDGAAPGPLNPWQATPGLADLEHPTCCCERCGFGACCPEEWYFENGVRVLARIAPRNQRLLLDATPISHTVFNAADLSYGISAGYSGTLGHYLGHTSFNYDEYGEVSFWGLNQWDNSAEVGARGRITTPSYSSTYGSLYMPFNQNIGGFNRVDDVTYDVRHRVNNVELNYWLRPRALADQMVLEQNGHWVRQCQPGWYWAHMVGLRAMFIDDGFGMHSRGVVQTGESSGTVTGDYVIDAHNSLLGFQVGGDLSYRACRWSLGTRYSVAPFINFANQQSEINSNGTADPLSTYGNFDHLRRTNDDTVAAAALNLGFTGSYRILPHLVLRAAYDLMWVPGLALAPDQLDFSLNPDISQNTTLAKLNTGGTVFYQGLTLGADLSW